jgi:hypothetical protein
LTTPAPSVVVSTDKANYDINDPIVVTVQYPDGGVPGTVLTVTATVTNADGSQSSGQATAEVGAVAGQALAVGVTDSFGDDYALVSNDPGTAVLSSTIGTPPAGA